MANLIVAMSTLTETLQYIILENGWGKERQMITQALTGFNFPTSITFDTYLTCTLERLSSFENDKFFGPLFFWGGGGRERLINLKFTGKLENSLMKLLTKYQPAKLTRLGLI